MTGADGRLDRYGEAYIRALDRQDFVTVAAILHEAQGDRALDRLLVEIDRELLREMDREQDHADAR